MSVEKRQRGPNYTQREKDILLSIVAKRVNIIENKKTNTITSQEKDNAWKEIATEFNAMAPNCINRTIDSLRKFYGNHKKDLRKRKADERMEFLRTGGGPPPKPKVTVSDEVLLSLVNNKTVYGLQSQFDADRNIEIESSSSAECASEESNTQKENISEVNTSIGRAHDWKRYTTADLKEIPSAELELHSSYSNNERSNSSRKDFRRRRPATVVRTLTSSHIAEKYDKLLDKRLLICNYEESKFKNNLTYEKEEHNLRVEALKLDIQIKKEELKTLQEK